MKLRLASTLQSFLPQSFKCRDDRHTLSHLSAVLSCESNWRKANPMPSVADLSDPVLLSTLTKTLSLSELSPASAKWGVAPSVLSS